MSQHDAWTREKDDDGSDFAQSLLMQCQDTLARMPWWRRVRLRTGSPLADASPATLAIAFMLTMGWAAIMLAGAPLDPTLATTPL